MNKTLLLCALALLAACAAKSDAKRDATPAATSATAAPVAQSPGALPPNHPPIGATDTAMADMHGGGALSQAPSQPVTGTVLETLDSGSFTYVRFKTSGGERWAAVGRTELPGGATITIAPTMVADRFASQPLAKTFDNLIFGALQDGVPPVGGVHAPMASRPAATAAVTRVPKAEGKDARTVAELWAGGSGIRDDQQVVVRGKVVKVLRGIMDRNWIHLRDGSGTPGKDDEITITSVDSPAVGSVVTVTGTVHLNRDFGSGYSFPVLIEQASVQ